MKQLVETKYIASIYPGVSEVIRRPYGPTFKGVGPNAARYSVFELKPVPKGRPPFVLEITDCFQTELDWKTGRMTAVSPIPVESIVADLLRVWTGNLINVPAGAAPGIMEISSQVPHQDELRQMKAQQTLLFEYWFEQGMKNARENNWLEISDGMRMAANYLGYKQTWSDRAIARDSDPCPVCGILVGKDVLACMNGHVVRTIPPEILALNPGLAGSANAGKV